MIFIKTIIEIFDEEKIFNVLASLCYEPEFLVLIGSEKVCKKDKKDAILRLFKHRGLKTKVFFYPTDLESFDKIIDEFRAIYDKMPMCYFDVTGGKDLALLATGVFCERENIPVFYFNEMESKFVGVLNCDNLEQPEKIKLSVEDILLINGGSYLRQGHFFPEEDTFEMEKYILDVWRVYTFNQRSWGDNVAFLQHANKFENSLENESLIVDCNRTIIVNKQMKVRCHRHIMQNLQDAGVITDLIIDEKRVSFKYINHTVKRCLMDVGIWLELYTFVVCKMSGYFDDVQTSVVVDWNGIEDEIINTINEIDVVLVKGIIPVFISCKIGIPSNFALNEIKLLAEKFGGKFAKSVIVTSHDVQKHSPAVFKRAEDMNITIIDATQLNMEEFRKKLIALTKV